MQTFQDVEKFLLDYNDDGTPINENTIIYNSKRIYRHYNYTYIISTILFIILLILIIKFEDSRTKIKCKKIESEYMRHILRHTPYLPNPELLEANMDLCYATDL